MRRSALSRVKAVSYTDGRSYRLTSHTPYSLLIILPTSQPNHTGSPCGSVRAPPYFITCTPPLWDEACGPPPVDRRVRGAEVYPEPPVHDIQDVGLHGPARVRALRGGFAQRLGSLP